MRITKRVVVGIWVLLVIFMGVLLLAYFSNRNMIKNFKKEKYEFNQFGFLGFTEPYVNPYNRGNIFYSLGDYDRAIAEYELALSHNPSEPADCMIRVNYALSLLAPIDADNVTEDNIDEVLEILDEAREILLENGSKLTTMIKVAEGQTLSVYGQSTHVEAMGQIICDTQSQRKSAGIDEFEQELLNQVEPTPTPTPTPDPSQDPSDPTNQPTPTPQDGQPQESEMTPEEQLAELQDQGLEERVGGSEDDIWTAEWNWGDVAYW